MTPEMQLKGVSRSGGVKQMAALLSFLTVGGERNRVESNPRVCRYRPLFSVQLGIYRAARVKTLITAIDPRAGASLTGCQISSCCGAPLILCPQGENSFRDNDVDCIQTHSFLLYDVSVAQAKISDVPVWHCANLPDSGGLIRISVYPVNHPSDETSGLQ